MTAPHRRECGIAIPDTDHERKLVFNLATCCCIAEHSLNCKRYAVLAKEILNCMEVKIISLEVCSKIKWKVESSALF